MAPLKLLNFLKYNFDYILFSLALTENLLFESAIEEFTMIDEQQLVDMFYRATDRKDIKDRIKAVIKQVKSKKGHKASSSIE